MAVPMLPPAPGRFSTTTLWFNSLPSGMLTRRASVSPPPPGANGTISVMGRLGQVSAPMALAAGPLTAIQDAMVIAHQVARSFCLQVRK
jgi:hypothetical protein